MDSPIAPATTSTDEFSVLALFTTVCLRAVISTQALANATPVVLLNTGLALLTALVLISYRVADSSTGPAKWSLRGAAFVTTVGFAIEGLLLYPRFIVLDIWMATLLASGIVALVFAATLTFRLDRSTQVVAVVSATVAAGALSSSISESFALSWIAPMLVALAVVSPVRLLFGLQRAQQAAIESHRQHAELSSKLALASAEILDSRHRESLSLIASGIAHEINNPITYLRGNLELLGEELETCSTETLELLSGVLAGVDAISGVVERIRSVFQGVLAPAQEVNLHETVRTAIASLSSSAGYYAGVSNRIATDITVDAHPADVYIIATNLLRNAVDATRGSDTASTLVDCEIENNEVRFVVEDAGCGMSTEQIARCLDPFYTTKANGGGMGIGLALCKAIADRTGNRLEITSTPGVGTRVCYAMKRCVG